MKQKLPLTLFSLIVLFGCSAVANADDLFPQVDNNLLIVQMDETGCRIERAIRTDGLELAGLKGAALLNSVSGNPDADLPEHDHEDWQAACREGINQQPITQPSSGHCCTRYIQGMWWCSHTFCPSH